MASKTVLIDAEITQYSRRPQDAARITKQVDSAYGLPALFPSIAPGTRAVRRASLRHDAPERLTHWIASYSVVVLPSLVIPVTDGMANGEYSTHEAHKPLF